MIHFIIFNRQKGFTLIETLVSVFLLSFIIIAFMLSHTQSHISTNVTQHRAIAVHLAQQRLEALKRLDQPGNDRNSNNWTSEIGSFVINKDGIRYTVTTSFIPNAELPNNIQTNDNLVPIRVTVSWNEFNNDSYSIFIDTIYIPY